MTRRGFWPTTQFIIEEWEKENPGKEHPFRELFRSWEPFREMLEKDREEISAITREVARRQPERPIDSGGVEFPNRRDGAQP